MNYSMLLKRLCPQSIEEQKNIYQGLCSKYNFEKILRGEKEPDILLLRGILERLGKSTEKFDLILQEEDYEQIEWKESIKELIQQEKYSLVEEKIKQYEKKIKKSELLKQQKIDHLKIELFLKQKEYKKAYEIVKTALSYTKQNWETEYGLNEEIWGFPMTITEIKLLQQFIELRDKLGKNEESYEEAKKMERFLNKFITDKELLATVYSRTVLFLSDKAYGYQDYEKCVFYCNKGIRCLKEAKSLNKSVEIFRLRAKAMKQGGMVAEREWKQAYLEAYSVESIYHMDCNWMENIEKEIEEGIWEFIQLEK